MLLIAKRNRKNGMVKTISLQEAINDLREFDNTLDYEFVNEKAAEYFFKIVKPETNIFKYSI